MAPGRNQGFPFNLLFLQQIVECNGMLVQEILVTDAEPQEFELFVCCVRIGINVLEVFLKNLRGCPPCCS
jgi:hypothetical protein